MTSIFLTPKSEGEAIELSRTLWRKKVLPIGEIDYKGRKIKFDKAYLTDLAEAYRDGAYDQVPFMLADESNRHTMDPLRFHGEVKGAEVGDDGLYMTMELSTEAAKLVKQNPKLGVSARIVEGYDRADGKKYPRAMQHVLGTLDPRIPGLGAWTEVALSGYDSGDEVLDLTAAEFQGVTMPKKPETGDSNTQTIDGLSPEDFKALCEELDIDPADLADGDDDADDAAAVTDAAAALAHQTKEPAVATLSNADRRALDLANEQIAELKKSAAHERFEAAKREYVGKGVPPALVELARPVLEAPDGFTIDLSNGIGDENTVDAADVVRKLLDSSVGYIELAKERGHSVDFANEGRTADDDKDAELLKAWGELAGDPAPEK